MHQLRQLRQLRRPSALQNLTRNMKGQQNNEMYFP